MTERNLEILDTEIRIEDYPCGWCNGSGNDESGLVIIGPTQCRICKGSKKRGGYRTLQHKLQQDHKNEEGETEK